MTREEAAKDPKRNPKKRRANYTQNQERQPGKTSHYNHAQKPPELIQGNQAQKRQSIQRPTERRKPPQVKKNPRNKIKAHSGRNTTPGKAETLPKIHTGTAQSIQNGNGARTARTDTGNNHRPQTTHHKPHRRTKRHEPEQIHTNSIKRHTGRNYKATDKRRTNPRRKWTKPRKKPEKPTIESFYMRSKFFRGFSAVPPGLSPYTPGGLKISCNIFGKFFTIFKMFEAG